MKPLTVKPLFLGPWLLVAGVLSYAAALMLGVFFGHYEGPSRAPGAWSVTWALAAALWWVYHGPRLCNMAYSMVTLQLPGARSTLLRGIALHMALSLTPALLFLLLWPTPHQEIQQLAAALWLGSCFGLLIISVPATLNVIPVTLLSLYWPVLAEPGLCLGLGALALALTAALWHWQLKRPRAEWLAPLGLVLDGYTLSFATSLKERLIPTPTHVNSLRAHPDRLRQDRLTVLLGLSCQTFRQRYGKRGQYLFCLVTGSVMGLVFWIQPSYNNGFLAMWIAVALVCIPLQPARTLVNLHDRNRAVLSELLLLPGLPPREHLQATLMRQLRSCMLERQVFFTLLIIALSSGNGTPTLQRTLTLLALSSAVLGAGLWLAKLAWQGALSRRQLNLGTALVVLGIYAASLVLQVF